MATKDDKPQTKRPRRVVKRAQKVRAARKKRLERASSSERKSTTSNPAIRNQILEGATEAMGERGYSETSVENILIAANISRRTFYRFFRNKEEILHELFHKASEMLTQAIRNAVMFGKTPQEKIENSIEVFLRAPQFAGRLTEVVHNEANRPGSPLETRRQETITEVIGILEEQVDLELEKRLDEFIYRGLIAGLEEISRQVYVHGSGSEKEIERARTAMLHLTNAALEQKIEPAG